MKNNEEKKYRLILILISLAVIAAFFASAHFLRQKNEAVSHALKSKATMNPIVSLSLSMSKELRQVAASYLWLRVDEYFHSTAVRLSENTEIVPLFKLITIFDPSFIDAYLVLAHHLAFHLGKTENALEVLRDGVENNLKPPASRLSELYFESGWISIALKRDTEEAIVALTASEKYMSKDCDPDNAHLAMRLLAFLKNSLTGSFDINAYRRNLSNEDIHKKLEEFNICTGDHEEEGHVHGPGCGHDHDGEGEDYDASAANYDASAAKEHKYSGQNPWHNPFLTARLQSAAAAYSAAWLLLALTLKLSRRRR